MRTFVEQGDVVIDLIETAEKAAELAAVALNLGFNGAVVTREDCSTGNVPNIMFKVRVAFAGRTYAEKTLSAALELVSVARGTSAEQTLAGWKLREARGEA